jgi:hypothetical protein
MARTAKKRSVPAALAKRAEKLAQAKRTQIAENARKDIALIKEKKDVVQAAFYEIGQALVRLSDPMVPRALGYASFKELLAKELGMGVETADRYKGMALRLHETDAIQMGAQKASAVVEVLDAAGAKGLPPGGRLVLAKGRTVDLKAAGADELEALAKELRRKKGKPARGRTSTAEERAIVKAIEVAAKKAGIREGSFECLATKPGKPADVRIRVSIADLGALHRALGAALKNHHRR